MCNKIIYVTKEEICNIKKEIFANDDIYVIEVDGKELNTEEEYVKAVMRAISCPYELDTLCLGWYNDYMMDLMWLEEKDIVMIIYNFKLMLKNNISVKERIIEDFEDLILPWWENDVIGHMVEGKTRKFMVYIQI